jgi:hypothetical protein
VFPPWVHLAVACLAVSLGGCGIGGDSDTDGGGPEAPAVTGSLPEKGSDLFVLRGPVSVTDQRMQIDADVVEWFTDRPRRKAGVAAIGELAEAWKGFAFDAAPPNAALAGDEIDAEVELMDPEVTSEGLSFAFKPIRGDVGAGEDRDVSVFIDSSEWTTDMHVYVQNESPDGFPCGGMTLANPDIVTAPSSWSVPPPATYSVPTGGYGSELFNAASKSGGTSFEVVYDIECDGGTYSGKATFKGKVPDSLSENSFSCFTSDTSTASPRGCELDGDNPSGYHTTAKAFFWGL